MDTATRVLVVGGTCVLTFGLLLGGVVLFDLGLTLDWVQEVEDAFAEASLGNEVSAVGTPLVLVGAGILCFGVLAGL